MNRTSRTWAVLVALVALLVCVPARAWALEAEGVDPVLEHSAGWDTYELLDGSYDTSVSFEAGESLVVKAGDGATMGSLYLRFYMIPGAWTLSYEDASGAAHSMTCGGNDFLHEFVPFEGTGATSCTLTFPSGASICTLNAFTPGDVPSWVQTWDPVCDQADLMVCSTHADDEILWLGGTLATYAAGRGLSTQVVYMTNYWSDNIKREHEKLDGLWTIGVRNYPVDAPFLDYYAETLEEGQELYDQEAVTEFFTEQVRRFKPLVVVCQAFSGEYGHGGHQVLARAVAGAVDRAGDVSYDADSAQAYGGWEVPKAYFHLYEEGQIVLDLRQPIEALGGMTAIEAANAAYRQHETQQWTWFYITDDPDDPLSDQLNCSLFGLYRSTVGPDTQNDMFENITTYEEQAEIAAREAAAAEAKLQAEREQAEAEQRFAEADRHADELSVPVIPIVACCGVALVLFVVYMALPRRRGGTRKSKKVTDRMRGGGARTRSVGRRQHGGSASRDKRRPRGQGARRRKDESRAQSAGQMEDDRQDA